MKNPILKQIHEAINPSEGSSKMNLSEKAQVLEQIKGYQSLGEVIYRSEGLKEASQKSSSTRN